MNENHESPIVTVDHMKQAYSTYRGIQEKRDASCLAKYGPMALHAGLMTKLFNTSLKRAGCPGALRKFIVMEVQELWVMSLLVADPAAVDALLPGEDMRTRKSA